MNLAFMGLVLILIAFVLCGIGYELSKIKEALWNLKDGDNDEQRNR